eukprot:Gb_03336 [translate_table: standard]
MLGIAARRSIDEALAKYRSGRWQPPAPPSPRILQLPKSSRRTKRSKNVPKPPKSRRENSNAGSFRREISSEDRECKPRGKLEVLFGQEREFSRSVPIVLLHPNAQNAINSPRRGKVTLQKSASKLSRGAPGSTREHCSDDARDIFELETKEEECSRDGLNNFSSDNEIVEQNGRWGSEDWKFQAEVLRAECNLLRMEKEVAVKRWEQGCEEMEHAVRMAHSLHSAVQTLVTGRKKILDEKNAEVVLQTTLQNQIAALQEKLEKLQKNSEFRENELKKCSNFDRQALFLQRRLDKLRKSSKERSYSEDTAKALQQRLEKLVLAACSNAQSESDKEENPVLGCWQGGYNEVQQLAEASLRIQRSSSTKTSLSDQRNRLVDFIIYSYLHWNLASKVTMLRRRLDSLSTGMNESKEAAAKIRKEYRSMLNSSGNCSSRRMDTPGRAEQASGLHRPQENKLCSERCKATIRKIAEQVQAETEQWSQVQEILHHVREEMEDLQKSRDFWEDHALHADEKIATLQAAMHEWRQKARSSEIKVSELQSEVAQLRNDVEQVRYRHALEQTRWLDARSRHTQALMSSGTSSIGMESENFDHHDASVNGAEMGNHSENRENEGKWYERKNSESEHIERASVRSSEGTSIKTCRITQNSHISSHHQPLIDKPSKLSRLATNQRSAGIHQQNDCVAGQLAGKKTKKKNQVLCLKENVIVQNKHSRKENLGKRDKVNRKQEHLGSEKSSCGSIRSPLADIGNASPFRIRRSIYPLSSDESSGLGSP